MTEASKQAIRLSKRASELLREGEHDESLALYQESFHLYRQTKLSLLEMCNAAGCLRNMGSIYRMKREYEEATQCWKQAEQFYNQCRDEITRVSSENRQVILEDALCVDALLVETLQSRAAIHFKHLGETADAVQCHQSALSLLILLDESEEWTDMFKHIVLSDGVAFRPLDREKHSSFLALSIDRMTSLLKREICDFSLYQTGLTIMSKRLNENKGNEKYTKVLVAGLIQVARVFDKEMNAEGAAQAIQNATEVEIVVHGKPSEESLMLLDNFGSEKEEAGEFDQAITYFEKCLLIRSRWLGEKHIDVAKSLINVARVMEAEGNSDGSLDLYRVAQSIYAEKVQSKNFLVQMHDADAILQLLPTLMEQERYEEVILYLNKCLEFEEQCDDEINFMDRSQLYFSLGKAYIGLCDFVSATVCFVEAAKVEGAVSQDLIYSMLDKVERLRREYESSNSKSDYRGNLRQSPVNQGNVSENLSKSGPSTCHRNQGSTPVTSGTGSGDSSSVNSKVDGYKGEGEDTDQDLDSDFNDSIDKSFPILQSETSDLLSGIDISVDAISMKIRPTLDETARTVGEENKAGVSNQFELPQAVGCERNNSEPKTSELQDSIKKKSFRFNGSPRRQSNVENKRNINELSPVGRFRLRKNGFESLPEEKNVKDDDEKYHDTPAESLLRPIEFVSVKATDHSFDDVSQITIPVVFTGNDQRNSQEWWWGVTAEGFGRWFPTSVVTKAVKAAEGFLSAEAIHSKVKAAPLHSSSDELSTENPRTMPTPRQGQKSDSKEDLVINSKKELSVVSQTQDEGIFSVTGPTSKKETLSEQIQEIVVAIETRKKSGSNNRELFQLYTRLAYVMRRTSDLIGAIDSSNEALKFARMTGEPSLIIDGLNATAELLMQKREYKQALSHFNEVLRLSKTQYGNFSVETAKALNSLGTLRAMEDQFGLAMDYHQEALEIFKECRGEDLKDPLVSQTLCLIGSVYYRERNSLSTAQAKRGDYKTFVEAGMLEVIGRAHEDRGSYKMAISFFEEKLQFIKDEHRQADECITTLNSLGMLSLRAGLFAEALDYFDRALTIQVRQGYDEIYIVTTRVLSAAVHHQLGDYARARDMLAEAYSLLKEKLGDHETVAAILYHIGVVEIAYCDLDKAMAALQQARRLQESILGVNHPACLRTIREIGNLFAVYESELSTAFEDFDFVLKEQKKIHGDRHPNIAETLHCIGCAYAKRKDYSEALRWLEECYYMRCEFLGVDHPHQATTLLEIAKIHLARGRNKRSLQICETVVSIRKDALSETHIDIGGALCQKGICLTALGEYREAEVCFREAFSIGMKSVGTSHPFLASVLLGTAAMQLRKCQFEDSRASIEKALSIYRESNVDHDFPGIVEANQLLEKVKRDEELCV